jgi:hypothetical protein
MTSSRNGGMVCSRWRSGPDRIALPPGCLISPPPRPGGFFVLGSLWPTTSQRGRRAARSRRGVYTGMDGGSAEEPTRNGAGRPRIVSLSRAVVALPTRGSTLPTRGLERRTRGSRFPTRSVTVPTRAAEASTRGSGLATRLVAVPTPGSAPWTRGSEVLPHGSKHLIRGSGELIRGSEGPRAGSEEPRQIPFPCRSLRR